VTQSYAYPDITDEQYEDNYHAIWSPDLGREVGFGLLRGDADGDKAGKIELETESKKVRPSQFPVEVIISPVRKVNVGTMVV